VLPPEPAEPLEPPPFVGEPPELVQPEFEPPELVPPELAPPEPPDPLVGGVLHVPEIEPGGRRQLLPGQQSPSIVQLLPDGTQFGPPFTLAQTNLPLESGVQGTPSQQSAADAQL